jgi:hypothetical protein
VLLSCKWHGYASQTDGRLLQPPMGAASWVIAEGIALQRRTFAGLAQEQEPGLASKRGVKKLPDESVDTICGYVGKPAAAPARATMR